MKNFKKKYLSHIFKKFSMPFFALLICLEISTMPVMAMSNNINFGIGDGNTTLMQIPWTNEIAQKYFMKNSDGSTNTCKSAWRFTSYALVTTTADRVANNAATKSWSDIAIATTYNIAPGKSLALRSNGSFNFPFDSTHYGNIFMIRIPWQNYETNINSILNYTYDINVGEDVNPAAANAYNCETIGWAFTANQTLDIIVRVESALINKSSTKYINLYFDTVSAGGTRKFGFSSRDFTVFSLGSGFDAEFIQYLTLLQILTQLTSGVPVNVSGLTLDGDITIDMTNIEEYLNTIIENQEADHITNNDIDLMVADILDLLQDLNSNGNVTEDQQEVIDDTQQKTDILVQETDNISQDFINDMNNIDLNDYTIGSNLVATVNWLVQQMESIFNVSGEFKILYTLPLILGIALFFIGRGSVVYRQGNIDRARQVAKEDELEVATSEKYSRDYGMSRREHNAYINLANNAERMEKHHTRR